MPTQKKKDCGCGSDVMMGGAINDLNKIFSAFVKVAKSKESLTKFFDKHYSRSYRHGSKTRSVKRDSFVKMFKGMKNVKISFHIKPAASDHVVSLNIRGDLANNGLRTFHSNTRVTMKDGKIVKETTVRKSVKCGGSVKLKGGAYSVDVTESIGGMPAYKKYMYDTCHDLADYPLPWEKTLLDGGGLIGHLKKKIKKKLKKKSKTVKKESKTKKHLKKSKKHLKKAIKHMTGGYKVEGAGHGMYSSHDKMFSSYKGPLGSCGSNVSTFSNGSNIPDSMTAKYPTCGADIGSWFPTCY